MKPVKQSWILAGGILSAVAASLCCVGPLAAIALGLGSFAAASWFAAWRPVFLGFTLALLALAWVFTLRARRMESAQCVTCAPTHTKRWPLALLSLCTFVVAGVALFPEAARISAARPQPALSVAAGASVLRVSIPSMDCAACAIGIESALRGVSGVRSAVVRYSNKEAEISYDPTIVSRDALVAHIDATGFKADLGK